MKEENYLHEVAVTAIVVKDGKFLIEQRSFSKKRFPGRWTVPGGRLHVSDYETLPKDTKEYWYNVLEKTLSREVREEVGLEVENVRYLTSLATVHDGKTPSLVISCVADYASGEIRLQAAETADAKWVSLEEAKQYDLIDGIFDELLMADEYLKTGRRKIWRRAENPSGGAGS